MKPLKTYSQPGPVTLTETDNGATAPEPAIYRNPGEASRPLSVNATERAYATFGPPTRRDQNRPVWDLPTGRGTVAGYGLAGTGNSATFARVEGSR